MPNLTTTPTTTTAIKPSITPTTPTIAQKLEGVRASLRTVAHNLEISEGRLLDFDTSDTMQRSLHASLRELEEVQMSVSVLERRTRAAG